MFISSASVAERNIHIIPVEPSNTNSLNELKNNKMNPEGKDSNNGIKLPPTIQGL